MKKTPWCVVVFVVLAAAITGCSGNVPNLGKYVPKDAGAVTIINIKNLREKLASASIDLDSVASMMKDDKDSSSTSEWNDFKDAGIDLDAEFYTFSKGENSMMNGKTSTMGVIALLKDAAAFEQYLKKKRPQGEIKNADGYQYLALGDDYVAGWTQKVFILAKVHNGKAAPGVYATGEGTLSQQLLTKLFTQAEGESVESVDQFKTAEKQQGDIIFYSAVAPGDDALSLLSISKVGDLIEGTYTTGVINFDNGKVEVSVAGYPSKTLGEILDKNPGHEIDLAALDNFPLPLSGFAELSVNPLSLLDVLKYAGAEETATQMLGQYNITMDDVAKAFKGDFAVAVSMGDSAQGTPGKGGKFVFSATIADKAAYAKIVAGLNAKGVQLPQNGMVAAPFVGSVAVSITDTKVVFASDINLLQQYLSGNVKTQLPDDVRAKIKGKAFAAYMNLHSLEGKGIADGNDTTVVKDLIITADKLDGKMIKGNAELRLFNDSQNSLAVLIKEASARRKNGKEIFFPGLRGIGGFAGDIFNRAAY